jgi:NADH-quinone oxidoreductase subunit B
MKAELEKRLVTGPDGVEFEVDPLRDYYCDALPEVQRPAYLRIVEDLFNWARAESIWILGFGTGCGAIEMRPLMTPRFDAYRYGIQWRPTPRQANLFVISGYLSVKTLKRVIRSYEQMQNPKYVVGLGSCTLNGGMYFDSYSTRRISPGTRLTRSRSSMTGTCRTTTGSANPLRFPAGDATLRGLPSPNRSETRAPCQALLTR